MSQKLALATGNAHKVGEFQELLGPRFDIVAVPIDVEENGTTFTANALIKAKAGCEQSGLPTLADDSGLAVDALGGRPGIHSARYAGPTSSEKITALLGELKDVPPEQRTASFHCALALVYPNGTSITVEGITHGVIKEAPAGQGGFGYDPIFYLPDLGKTYAELTSEEKNHLSHRGRAVQLLLERL